MALDEYLRGEDERQVWERLGYHMYGDPFREQRFSEE